MIRVTQALKMKVCTNGSEMGIRVKKIITQEKLAGAIECL